MAQLYRAEMVLLGLLLGLLGTCLAAAAYRDQAVHWAEIAPAIVGCFALIGIGMYLRTVKQALRLAMGVIGFGVFMAFSAIVSILALTVFPFANPMIDETLMTWDARLGFSWLAFVESMSGYPMASLVLRYVYLSSLPQIVGLVAVLAMLHRPVDLHRFLLVGFLAMFATLAFWTLYPSVGPSAFVAVPAEIEARLGLVTNMQAGANLLHWAREGHAVITPEVVTGVVAFPSFHIVMACMVAWFSWRTPVFGIALVLNLAMVPATILHGGHHLVDVLGGIATFGIVLWASCRLLPRMRP